MGLAQTLTTAGHCPKELLRYWMGGSAQPATTIKQNYSGGTLKTKLDTLIWVCVYVRL